MDTLEDPKMYEWARKRSIAVPLLRIYERICTFRRRFNIYKVTLNE